MMKFIIAAYFHVALAQDPPAAEGDAAAAEGGAAPAAATASPNKVDGTGAAAEDTAKQTAATQAAFDAAYKASNQLPKTTSSFYPNQMNYKVEYQCLPVKKAAVNCRPYDLQFMSTDPEIISAERQNSTQFALSVASRIALALSIPLTSIEVYPLSGSAQVFKANNSAIPNCPGFDSCPMAELQLEHSTKRHYYVHWHEHQAPALNLLQKGRTHQPTSIPIGPVPASIKVGAPAPGGATSTYAPLTSMGEAQQALKIATFVKDKATDLLKSLARSSMAHAEVLNGKLRKSKFSPPDRFRIAPSYPLQPVPHAVEADRS